MAAIPIGLHLKEGRAAPGPRSLHRGGNGLIDRDDILAIDDQTWYLVRIRLAGEVVDRRRLAEWRVLRVEIVGHDHDHRCLPDGRHIQRLMERADVRGTVA